MSFKDEEESFSLPSACVCVCSGKLKEMKAGKSSKMESSGILQPAPTNFRPSEDTSVGGLMVNDIVQEHGKGYRDAGPDTKLQGKTFPSLVVLAKPSSRYKEIAAATRNKLDSKVKLVLMLTPNKFAEWLIQEGLLRSEQRCGNHHNTELKLGT